MKYDEIIRKLESLSNPEDVEGMVRFGINPKKTYAVRNLSSGKLLKKLGKIMNSQLNSGKQDIGRLGSYHA